jgi:uncharacterized membrane protein
MTLIPEYLDIVIGVKLQLSPINIAMLLALGLCIAIAWRWYKRRS